MKQPCGISHPDFPHYVCKLKKVLYSLQHAPQAWFHSFNSFLLSHGFVYSTADPSMFAYRTDSQTLVLLHFLDDIILTSSSSSLLHTFISLLCDQFAMKDLGELSYFLGIQMVRTSLGLFLSQHKYVVNMLHKLHCHTVKPVTTASAARTKLSLSYGEFLADSTKY